MHRFENLEIWKIAQDYGNRLYIVSRSFPREELFALSDQLKRAAVSISSNIAEGSGGTRKEFAHFLIIAVRSALETVNILHFAQSQGYITQEVRLELYEESDKLIRKIRAFKNSLSIV